VHNVFVDGFPAAVSGSRIIPHGTCADVPHGGTVGVCSPSVSIG
jgi:hypothetical protein